MQPEPICIRRSPSPAERLHDSVDGCLVDARTCVARAALHCAGALKRRCAVHEVIGLDPALHSITKSPVSTEPDSVRDS